MKPSANAVRRNNAVVGGSGNICASNRQTASLCNKEHPYLSTCALQGCTLNFRTPRLFPNKSREAVNVECKMKRQARCLLSSPLGYAGRL